MARRIALSAALALLISGMAMVTSSAPASANVDDCGPLILATSSCYLGAIPNGVDVDAVWDGFYLNPGGDIPWNPSSGWENKLIMQTDGNLVDYHISLSTGVTCPVWATGTQRDGGYRLIMQSDGNLVVYNRSGGPVWASHTAVTRRRG